jgi:hypothetical protein
MEAHYSFLLGCLGALAPEVVRLYTIKHKPEEFRWSAFYIVVSLLFAVLGGVVALLLPATTYWGAMYAGVSTPTLLNVSATRALAARNSSKKGPILRTRQRSYLESFLGGL